MACLNLRVEKHFGWACLEAWRKWRWRDLNPRRTPQWDVSARWQTPTVSILVYCTSDPYYRDSGIHGCPGGRHRKLKNGRTMKNGWWGRETVVGRYFNKRKALQDTVWLLTCMRRRREGIMIALGREVHFGPSDMAPYIYIGLSCTVPLPNFHSLLAFAFLSQEQWEDGWTRPVKTLEENQEECPSFDYYISVSLSVAHAGSRIWGLSSRSW